MRLRKYQPSLFSLILISVLFFMVTVSLAQDEGLPAPQFLYRYENQLILVDGYSGETIILPIEVNNADHFEWSPDGSYILASIREDGNNIRYCINLFDVATLEWVYDEPISCSVLAVTFNDNGQQITYANSNEDQTQTILWLFDLADDNTQELNRFPPEGVHHSRVGFENINWSPSGKYLTAVFYEWVGNETRSLLLVINTETEAQAYMEPSTYYARFYPIWSDDESWMLLNLTTLDRTRVDDKGDVFLYNSDTGEKYRITYTPATTEYDIHWTDEGEIAFTEIIHQTNTLSIEDARNIEFVSYDELTLPERHEESVGIFGNQLQSADSNVMSWTNGYDSIYEIFIGGSPLNSGSVIYSAPIENAYRTIIGWRPTTISYPQE